MKSKRVVVAGVIGVLVAVVGVVFVVRSTRSDDSGPTCGPGFARVGPRCCIGGSGTTLKNGDCVYDANISCPAPLVPHKGTCDEPEHDVVDVPAMTVTIGPSDWEAEGRVTARTFKVGAFKIDRFEVSRGRWCELMGCKAPGERARAITAVSLGDARELCARRKGRLPTDDEWLAAAAGEKPRRYPWGDTGAVCRRAAWGLVNGPCGQGIDRADTVGAHPDGASPLGIHDLAGNAAEWVEGSEAANVGFVRGGSWKSSLATELRTWLRREVPTPLETFDPSIGFRCAYDVAPSEVPTKE